MRKIWIRFKQRSPHHAPRAEYFVYESGWWQTIPMGRAVELLDAGKAELMAAGDLEMRTIEYTHKNARYLLSVEREDLSKSGRFLS